MESEDVLLDFSWECNGFVSIVDCKSVFVCTRYGVTFMELSIITAILLIDWQLILGGNIQFYPDITTSDVLKSIQKSRFLFLLNSSRSWRAVSDLPVYYPT